MSDKIYGLLGHHLGHSWSVATHTALGCPDYRLYDLEPGQLEAFLRQENLGGINITMPYKQTVMPYCDTIDDLATAIGCVNVIVRENGKLHAHNTDAIGFCRTAQRANIDFSGKKVLVLGSGGASLTAQAMSRKMEAREIVVISRHGENNYQNLSRHADADILVNATPVGMFPHNGESPVDLSHFSHLCGVIDFIYNPARTALIQQAEQLGIPCSGGLPIMTEQAVAAEEFFFHKTFPKEVGEDLLKQLQKKNTNIVLIGMPGCGKTTVGTLLAKISDRDLIDVDVRIEQRAGKSIPEIFSTEGEESFRRLEAEETAEAGKQLGKIIVTGGGVVKTVQNKAALQQNGRIYQLDRCLAALATKGRPLSEQADLQTMQAEREPLYRSFRDILIDNNGTAEETAQAIWRDFCAYSGD